MQSGTFPIHVQMLADL